jgi:hypothetical protein
VASTASYPWSGVSNTTVFLYGISALSLVALADPFPKVAIMFTVILIAGVLLTHASDYASMLSAVTPVASRGSQGVK